MTIVLRVEIFAMVVTGRIVAVEYGQCTGAGDCHKEQCFQQY